MKDPIISIKDLFATCIRKGRMFIILAIVFAIALCGMKYVSDVSAQKKAESAKQDETGINAALSEAEMEQVEEYVQAVLWRDEARDYKEHSIYMNANPYEMYYTQAEYHVQSETADAQRDAVIAFRNYITDGLPYDLSRLDGELDPKYFREILSQESTGYNSYQDSGIVKIKILAADEKQAKKFAEYVDTAMQEHALQLQEAGLSFTVTKVYDVVANEYYASIIPEIRNQKDALREYEADVTSKEAALSRVQMKEAYKLLQIKEDGVIAEEPVTAGVSVNIAYLILGAILGICLGIVWVAVSYIFSNTVKTEQDLQDLFHVTVLGHLTCRNLTVEDKMANRIFYSGEVFDPTSDIDTLASRIKVYCVKKDVKKIELAVSADENERVQMQALAEALQKKQITCALLDINDMEAFANAEDVVLTAKVGAARYSEVEKTLLFCKDQNINVLGYITIV